MDAPTTPSAGDGTSGGGSGWFTPRRPPKRTEDGHQQRPGAEGPEAADVRRPASIRPLGRAEEASPGASYSGAPTGSHTAAPVDERISAASGSRTAQALATAPADQEQAPAVDTTPRMPAQATRQRSAPPAAQPHPAPQAAQPHPAPQAAQPRFAPAAGVPQHTATTGPQHAPEAADPQHAPAAADDPRHAAEAPGPQHAPEVLGPQHAPEAADPQSAPPAAAEPEAEALAQSSKLAKPSVPVSPDAALVQRTMAEIGPVADQVTSYFYALLFTRHPDLRPLFPAAMDTQRDRLLKALLTAAENIDRTDVLVSYLKNLGRGHRKYGTRPEHYPAVGECLIGSLSRYASAVWDEETEAAWVRTYTTISQVMIDAAAEDELRAPAWWFAEVVAHDLRTPDIAVVTVRPDQPYPFLAGQYTSLETPWWPRIWRHYSFASAPRSDGLLSFHVKAVPAGWVSNALVHHARPGDVLRLGPPAGSMTVDHTTDSGLLCLGGGTGIAPIKALVEDVAEHGRRRPVDVFYGARTDHDLYDIDTMLRLQQAHPWLAVRPIVDQRSHLPDAVREYGPWDEYDAYLSGPPGMIRSGRDALRDAGIPEGRIRHDSVEELVAAARD
ncbi:globin domain-containing protein [Streptomyces sp. NPDC005900]|uniref:globin domain-containing protein n=1 Tax=Streptomyces sp. NPDC005900 TaxID=3154569 RepID=UPI0033E5A9EE